MYWLLKRGEVIFSNESLIFIEVTIIHYWLIFIDIVRERKKKFELTIWLESDPVERREVLSVSIYSSVGFFWKAEYMSCVSEGSDDCWPVLFWCIQSIWWFHSTLFHYSLCWYSVIHSADDYMMIRYDDDDQLLFHSICSIVPLPVFRYSLTDISFYSSIFIFVFDDDWPWCLLILNSWWWFYSIFRWWWPVLFIIDMWWRYCDSMTTFQLLILTGIDCDDRWLVFSWPPWPWLFHSQYSMMTYWWWHCWRSILQLVTDIVDDDWLVTPMTSPTSICSVVLCDVQCYSSIPTFYEPTSDDQYCWCLNYSILVFWRRDFYCYWWFGIVLFIDSVMTFIPTIHYYSLEVLWCQASDQ